MEKTDTLTKLLDRTAIEEQIDERLEQEPSGILLMIDVDDLKGINHSCGYLVGDKVLEELARIMKYIFFRKDLIGRVGEDEFAVFLGGEYTEDLVYSKVETLRTQAAQAGRDMGIGNRLHLTVGADFAKEGDDFESLYRRTNLALRLGKLEKKKVISLYTPMIEALVFEEGPRHEMVMPPSDMKYICQQLAEKGIGEKTGAYCQDYQTFLSIYRFLERGLSRTGMNVQLILISLMDRYGSFIALEEREELMEQLRESIGASLRFSDIYTQYSSCQFLAMTPGATPENVKIAASRIHDAFMERLSGRQDIVLYFSYYPLQKVNKGKNKDRQR